MHDFQIVATEEDNSTHIGRFDFIIELINWNDELPIFEKLEYVIEVNETIEAGKFLERVHATDRDIGDRVL